MATIEQVRQSQEEIVAKFQLAPARYNQRTRLTQRQVANKTRMSRKKAPSNPPNRLPLPSSEAMDFIQRALSNPNFRALMERLANE